MTREWVPGDVALVEAGCWANRKVALRLHEGWSHTNGVSMDSDGIVSPIRPLVVIDPESSEDVRALADLFCANRWDHTSSSTECDPLTFSSMQAALREFATPTPTKPEEPTGLGAVVDYDGCKWVGIGDGWFLERPQYEEVEPRRWAWSDFPAAVRKLSEGVVSE